MKIQLVVLNLAVCLAVVQLRPAAARACSCLAASIGWADPADAIDDVPLNKALVVAGMFVRDSVVLEDQAGEAVAFTLNAGPTTGPCAGTWAELIPKQPLAPHTQYTIRVTPEYPQLVNDDAPDYITFTTGSSMLADEVLEMPKGNASMVLNARSSIDCGSTKALVCASVAPGKSLEVVARRGDREVMRWVVPDEIAREMTFGFEAAPDCVEFRQRAANGKRSPALKFCGDALKTREFRSSDSTGSGFACHDGKFGVDASDRAEPGDKPMVQPSDDPSQAAAGSRAPSASDPKAAPANAEEAEHRSYGCSTLSRTNDSHAPWLLMAAGLLFAARSGKRRRRSP